MITVRIIATRVRTRRELAQDDVGTVLRGCLDGVIRGGRVSESE